MKDFHFTKYLIAIQFLTTCFIVQDVHASENRSKRIVYGTISHRGQFPYACHIGWFWPHESRRDPNGGYPAGLKPLRTEEVQEPRAASFNSKFYQCSCVIIHERYVMTAAHCFQPAIDYYNKTDQYTLEINSTNWPLVVRAGFVDAPLNEAGMQERNGNTVYVHWAYKNQSTLFDVDIAIVKLKYTFDTKSRWQRVQVANFGTVNGAPNRLNLYCIGVGYGQDEYQLPSPEDKEPSINDVKKLISLLRYFKVKVGPARYCKYLQRKLNVRTIYFDTSYLCAVSVDATFKQFNCEHDLGGPLVCDGVLVGVLSQRRERSPCDLVGNSFSMYTNVGSDVVMEWLDIFIPDFKPTVFDIPFEEPWTPEPVYAR